MQLKFLNFILDQAKHTLFYEGMELNLSKKNYALLNYLAENNQRLVTKDEIMTHVWDGRVVSENTLNQNISTLRKLLAQYSDESIIKTMYGRGFEFTPNITLTASNNNQPANGFKKPAFYLMGFIVVVLVMLNVLMDLFNPVNAESRNLTPVILMNDVKEGDWLNNSSHDIFNLLASLPAHNNVIETEGTDQTEKQELLENYWRINPATEAIQSKFEFIDQVYHLELSVILKEQSVSEKFSDVELVKLITKGNQWLTENSSLEASQTPTAKLISQDSHTLELYMRGFHEFKQGDFTSAANYTELAIKNNPGFYLARLQMADIKYRQGDNEGSLAELESLSQINTPQEIGIMVESLRGDVLDTAGQYDEAVKIYQQLIQNYESNSPIKLMDVRYNLSYTLTSLAQYQEALEQLDIIKRQTNQVSNTGLIAHTLQKQGSIHLQLGQVEQATQAADKSLELFNQLADEMSGAKVKILLARIANYQSDFKLAINHLSEAVAIYRDAGFSLGVGATLNELVYAQRSTGQLDAAWKNMSEMKQVALDIDYFALLMAAKEAEFSIALSRDQFKLAAGVLNDYLTTSQVENYSRGLFKHNLYALQLAIAEKQPEAAQLYIDNIEKHIEKTGEKRYLPELKIQQARVKLLLQKPLLALKLLNDGKTIALNSSNLEMVNQADNFLLGYYLEQKDFSAMEEIFKVSEANIPPPLPYPFLLYKSKLKHAQGQLFDAISLAQLCKQKANELWRSEDARYLNDLINQQNTQQ